MHYFLTFGCRNRPALHRGHVLEPAKERELAAENGFIKVEGGLAIAVEGKVRINRCHDCFSRVLTRRSNLARINVSSTRISGGLSWGRRDSLHTDRKRMHRSDDSLRWVGGPSEPINPSRCEP